MAARDTGSNDVTITTISGGDGGSTTSMIVDVPVTLIMPPAYDTLSPLYDDKDLPKYCEVVAIAAPSQAPVSREPPPSYNVEPTSTDGIQHSDCTSSAPASQQDT